LYNDARAACQSCIVVASEVSSTSPISSSDKPAKKRNSATRALRRSKAARRTLAGLKLTISGT
jgi:hypothetical protein